MPVYDGTVEQKPRKREVRPYRGPRLNLPPHPNAPDPVNLKAVRKWLRQACRPTAVDLFCGAGGLSLGLTNAGFTVLVGADNDPFSLETHLSNIGGLSYLGDLNDPTDFLRHLDAWNIKNVDLVAGGVPCQPFSRAGRSKIKDLVKKGIRPLEDPRTGLWRAFISVVEFLNPRAILLENVPDFAVWNDGQVLLDFREILHSLGYTTTFRILSAFEYGVPQHRARLFVVGLKSGRELEWPEPSSQLNTLHDAIGDLPIVEQAQREERLFYEGPKTEFQKRMRDNILETEQFWIYDHITRDIRADDAEAFAFLKPGQTYKDLPDHLKRYRSDIFTDKYNRLRWDGLSRTITAHMAKDAYWYIHPEQNRTLSIREAIRLQTFPDWFRFAGEPSHQYRQIGNAVPPILAETLGRKLKDALKQRGRPRKKEGKFRKELLEWHENNSRFFPWRTSSNPWHILIAETCLRRTRAEQVVSVYSELIKTCPTPEAMVKKSEDVLRLMGSLGLRWRAENLIELADNIVNLHAGKVPETTDELLSLPGIGEYVANAIQTFAFNKNAILVDTNTQRIVKRLCGLDKVSRWKIRSELYDLAGIYGANASFNYSLLDFAALVCKSKQPLCSQCPVKRHCITFSNSKG